MIMGEYLAKWMEEELPYQQSKFSHGDQVRQLRTGRVTTQEAFGGQAANYWNNRLQKLVRASAEFKDPKDRLVLLPQAAQYAGKTLTSLTALYSTLRTQNGDTYGGIPQLVINDVTAHLTPEVVKSGYRWLDTPDFDDTQAGMGTLWYATRVARHGIPAKNLGILGDLIVVRDIYLDAASMAAAQFEECLIETGTLPVGGTSSGNVTLWTPGE
jgi:hypothetical protein